VEKSACATRSGAHRDRRRDRRATDLAVTLGEVFGVDLVLTLAGSTTVRATSATTLECSS